MIITGKYSKKKLYNNIYEYTCPEGHHFESYGINYGQVVYGGEIIQNPYIIKPNNYEENMDNNNITNINNTNTDNG